MKAAPHIVRKKLRNGIAWYVYAWRGGPQVFRSDGPKKPKIDAKIMRLIVEAIDADRSPDPDKLASLIAAWRKSPEWAVLAENTKKTWGSALAHIETKWEHVPLAVFDDRRMKRKIVEWRDSRSNTPRAADIGITVLHALLKFGVLRGRLTINVAADIPKLYRGGNRATIIWTDEQIERFGKAAQANEMIPAFDALRLAVLTGLRREDLASLRWEDVTPKAIRKLAKKASRKRRFQIVIPRGPALNALLADLERRSLSDGVDTVLVDGDGKSWSPDRLSKAIAKVRDIAGIVHIDAETGEKRAIHLHDARGTFASKIMMGQTDLTNQDVADMMGWSAENVSRIREVYVDQTARVVAIAERSRGVL